MQIVLNAVVPDYARLPLETRFANAASFVDTAFGPRAGRLMLQASAFDFEADHLDTYCDKYQRTALHLFALAAAKGGVDYSLQAATRNVVCKGVDLHWRDDCGLTALQRYVQEAFRLDTEASMMPWVELLHQAGVDLEEYGTREAGMWLPFCCDYARFRARTYSMGDMNAQVLLEMGEFGPSPEDWMMRVRWVDFINVYEIRPPPGSWTNKTRWGEGPTTSLWLPCPGQEDDSFWTCIREVEIKSEAFPIASTEQLPLLDVPPWHEDVAALLSVRAEDDASPLPLALSCNRAVARKRSYSHPPLGRSRQHGFEHSKPLRHLWVEKSGGHFCNLGNGRALTDRPRHTDKDGVEGYLSSITISSINPGHCVRYHGHTERIWSELQDWIRGEKMWYWADRERQALVDSL